MNDDKQHIVVPVPLDDYKLMAARCLTDGLAELEGIDSSDLMSVCVLILRHADTTGEADFFTRSAGTSAGRLYLVAFYLRDLLERGDVDGFQPLLDLLDYLLEIAGTEIMEDRGDE